MACGLAFGVFIVFKFFIYSVDIAIITKTCKKLTRFENFLQIFFDDSFG